MIHFVQSHASKAFISYFRSQDSSPVYVHVEKVIIGI